MRRAVLFDLDGTLVDLPVDIERVREQLRVMFEPLGYSSRFAPILERIAEASSNQPDPAVVQRRALALLDQAELAAAAVAGAVPGAQELVARLVDANVVIGIITNNCRGCVAPALHTVGLADAPWRVIISRDDAAAKPDPTGLLTAARALLPEKVGTLWLVGDGERDIQAVHNARELLHDADAISLVAVGLIRRANENRLRAAQPDHVIDALSLLPSLVGQKP